jgi:hypothetical protein
MGICILGMGECGNKSDSRAVTNITNINKSITNMLNSTKNSSIVQSFNTQSNKVRVVWPKGYGPTPQVPKNVIGCSFFNEQTMDSKQKVSISLDLSSTTNLQKEISSAIKADQQQATAQKNDFLATTSNSSNSYTEINQVIDNLVETNITDETVNELKQIIKNFQGNELILEGPVDCTDSKSPYLSQNVQTMLVNQISESLTRKITNTSLSEMMAVKAEASQSQTTAQENKGASSLLDSFFNGIKGLMTGPIMIIGLIILVILIVIIVFRKVLSKKIEEMPVGPMGMMRMMFGFAKKGRKKIR